MNISDGVTRELVNYIKRDYPDEIMLTTYNRLGLPSYNRITNEIYDITAYCLGWLDTLPEAERFPELKRDIPAAFTYNAYEQEYAKAS